MHHKIDSRTISIITGYNSHKNSNDIVWKQMLSIIFNLLKSQQVVQSRQILAIFNFISNENSGAYTFCFNHTVWHNSANTKNIQVLNVIHINILTSIHFGGCMQFEQFQVNNKSLRVCTQHKRLSYIRHFMQSAVLSSSVVITHAGI